MEEEFLILALLGAGTLLGSWLLCHALRPLLLALGVVDRPNARSSHSEPTVRGGGLSIIIVAVIGLLALHSLDELRSVQLVCLAVTGLVLSSLSFIDDIRPLSSQIRFSCQAAVAFFLMVALGWKTLEIVVSEDLRASLPFPLAPLLVFLWLVGYTNAFNFMDGINGLAASQATISGVGGWLIALTASADSCSSAGWASLVIGCAAAGFLPHNFPNARMFMGDAGSAPLGFLLAVAALWIAIECGWHLFIPIILLHANFVLDTGLTIVRRVWRREKWHEAHREHFYQRLVRSGKSHRWVTASQVGLQIVVVTLMVCYVHFGLTVRLMLAGSVIAIWLCYFWFAEAQFASYLSKHRLLESRG